MLKYKSNIRKPGSFLTYFIVSYISIKAVKCLVCMAENVTIVVQSTVRTAHVT